MIIKNAQTCLLISNFSDVVILYFHFHVGPQCIAPGFPIEDEKILMPGMILSDGKPN